MGTEAGRRAKCRARQLRHVLRWMWEEGGGCGGRARKGGHVQHLIHAGCLLACALQLQLHLQFSIDAVPYPERSW